MSPPWLAQRDKVRISGSYILPVAKVGEKAFFVFPHYGFTPPLEFVVCIMYIVSSFRLRLSLSDHFGRF